MPEWLSTLIAVIGALGGRELIALWLTQRANRRVTDAEARKMNAEADLTLATAGEKTLGGVWTLVAKLEKQQEDLERRADDLECEIEEHKRRITWLDTAIGKYAERITYLMSGIQILFQQFQEHKITPNWKPDEWEPPTIDDQE